MQRTRVQVVQDFRRARSRASMERVVSRLRGRPADLLAYEEVRQLLRAREQAHKRLEDIPLDSIIGSVGRYSDFTRSFLPRRDSDQDRWARVKTAMTSLEGAGVPPIEVYQIGDAYFVLDGNHRVSVARELGSSHIEAHVTKVATGVPLSPEVEPDELILKAEYADFLTDTHLDELFPQVDLTVTAPGKYALLKEHIAVHRYFKGLEWQREIPYSEAVVDFFEWIYLPLVDIIRERGLLRDFPDRTETDLYLWLGEHRAELGEIWGWEIDPSAAADDLAEQHSSRGGRVAARVLDVLSPVELTSRQTPGSWRREYASQRERLFGTVMVAINGDESGWTALDQALNVVRREQGQLRGLHVVEDKETVDGEDVQGVRAEFDRRCGEAGVHGSLVIRPGRVARQICAGARWSDLAVLHMAHPPGTRVLARLTSGVRTLIHRCSRPLLMVPGDPSPMDRVLLAYDASPKANEALYIATYMASMWGARLTVVTVQENGRRKIEPLTRAEDYLAQQGVPATSVHFRAAQGRVSEAILQQAADVDADLLVMGGYGHTPLERR